MATPRYKALMYIRETTGNGGDSVVQAEYQQQGDEHLILRLSGEQFRLLGSPDRVVVDVAAVDEPLEFDVTKAFSSDLLGARTISVERSPINWGGHQRELPNTDEDDEDFDFRLTLDALQELAVGTGGVNPQHRIAAAEILLRFMRGECRD